MVLFIKRLFIFTGFFVLFITMVVASWLFYNDIPAPNFSNSISYNEKMQFMHRNFHNSTVKVLAVGSSMTLNNLDSEMIAEKFNTTQYLNSASFGQNMKENFELIKICNQLYKPKNIIICSNYIDFYGTIKKIDYKLITEYLSEVNNHSLLFYLKAFDLHHLLNQAKATKVSKAIEHEQDYLGYDKYGGVVLMAKNFNIIPDRWEGKSFTHDKLDSKQYQYLDSIAAYCHAKNIILYFIQTPFRKGFYDKLDSDRKNLIENHVDQSEKIIRKYPHYYVNTNKVAWPDSLFVDYTHFNETGALLFTRYWTKEVGKN